ncbi:RING/FYVE/PHD zinc finger superfamily protein [Klebsormidium nitens]|uniref:RING/FYVE/PHD zinc finger superfamily protein n=1 Tax=Klebsormidium nitens TaxID=105231 RepID=A0A1Y1I2M4_KLENI|nr:RING/FYVE/PHD zinc finger superfamily protein [Klebsormidium nitens]|eukprot:GAQ85164.1 RING/FYVE/PHD zinc finger superfamily protein [Klebsormidium nitens]
MGRSEDNTSESEDWGDDGWTVACPCGITYDDGEEMVECDACRVWVHTRCCRVPRGLTHYVCERCRGEQHRKQLREEVEVAALLADLPSARSTPFDERSPFFSNSSTSFPDTEPASLAERTLALQSQTSFDEGYSIDFPLSQRVHTHGVTGGEEVALSGAPFFSKQLWRHQLMVPKPMDLQAPELPSHLLLEADSPDLYRGHAGGLPSRSPEQPRLRRGVQAKVERRKRLMEVVERYEQRRRLRSEEESRGGAVCKMGGRAETSRGCTSSCIPAVESRERSQVSSVTVANGNASSELSSPGGTSWTGGYVPRNPYALKKAAVLEYMQTSQSRCASCGSAEAPRFHEVKGLEGPVCDTCVARHRDQKFCPHCVHIYQEEEEKAADPGVWLVCIMCSRMVHKECQMKKPLNGTGPANRSSFLCSGCVREKKRARLEREAKQQLAGDEAGVDVGRASLKSSAVLRSEELPHVTSYELPVIGLADECSRPGGNADDFREAACRTTGEVMSVSDLPERPVLRLSIKNGSGEDSLGVHLKDGFYAQRLQLMQDCSIPSPQVDEAAAVATVEEVGAEAARLSAPDAGQENEGGRQETEEAAGVPTPSGPEPELQRRDSDPGSISVKNGDGRASGGEGTVDSVSRRQDRAPSQLPSSPLARAACAAGPQNGADHAARPGSPSPSSSSNSSSSQAQDMATPPVPQVAQGVDAHAANLPVSPADPLPRATTSPRSHITKPPSKLLHSLSVPARPKALSLSSMGRKFMDIPDTPGSVTSEHKPSKHPQGAARPVHLGPSGRLTSSRPSHPTGLRLHHAEGRSSLRQPLAKGVPSHPAPPLPKKEFVPAPPNPKGMAEMPPPPPPAAPKRPAVTRSGSEPHSMNDEELALLLHQELNSSPRMPRVSRSKKPGANGVIPSKRSSSVLATPVRRSQSGDVAEGNKQESDEMDPGPGEGDSGGEGQERRVKVEVELEDSEELPAKPSANGVHTLPELIQVLGSVSQGSLDSVVEAVSKHWHSLRTAAGEPYPPLQRQAIVEALSCHEEWAQLAKLGLPTKRKRTSPSILSDSDEDDHRDDRSLGGKDETVDGGALVDGSRVARRKRSRRTVADLSDTSDADDAPAPKSVLPKDSAHLPYAEHHSSPRTTDLPPANGNGHRASPVSPGGRPLANGYSQPPARSSSSGPLSNSSAGDEEALSRRQGPPRRKRSRIDARMELGVRQSGGSGSPEEE